jgi:hypothetical protein
MCASFRLDAARDFAPLQQEKVPGQRKQSEAERSPRSSSGSDAMCASRRLSHEIAWDYSTQKGAAGPWGRSR